MYNALRLDKSHWRYQLYLRQDNSDPHLEPQIKVIKTLVYGVKSSGNQTERALKLTEENIIKSYPKASEVSFNDIYVDDCISGTHSKRKLMSENLGIHFKGVCILR